MAVVRERERGNMELLIATPLSRAGLMIGKVLPYAVIGLVQTTLILALGISMFDVPLRGSLLDVYIASLLLILANLAMGLPRVPARSSRRSRSPCSCSCPRS